MVLGPAYRGHAPVTFDTVTAQAIIDEVNTLRTTVDNLVAGTVGGHAKYAKTTAQTVANEVRTKITWNSTVSTHVDVSFTSGTSDFTLNRAGVWLITAIFLWDDPGAGTAYRVGGICNGAANFFYIEGTETITSSVSAATAYLVHRFAAGDVVAAYGYQSSGGNLNTYGPLTGDNAQRAHITLTWLKP